MRFLWPFGGSLLNKEFKSNLMSKESQAGLQFRQDLLKYQPPGVVSFDHAEAVNALAQGQLAMITEWSAFYSTLADPATSKLGDCLAVAPEPAGPPAPCPRWRFSLAVASQATPEQQKATWLFIQWATSEAIAKAYVEAGGRVGPQWRSITTRRSRRSTSSSSRWSPPGRRAFPEYRPRFPAWPAISEIVAEWGSKMMLGEVTVEGGSKEIGTRMEAILGKDGYYDGKKKLLQ